MIKKTMLRSKLLYILSFYLLLGVSVFAQQTTTVRATVQPSDILIGEQAVVEVEVIVPQGETVVFPMYPDTLVRGVEVLNMSPVDTVKTEVWTLKQKYLITSFDSTLYHIPYIPVIHGTDTIKSNSFGFKVTSPQLSDSTMAYLEKLKNAETDSIDFEKLGIHDVKPVMREEFVWSDYLLEMLIIPIINLLILLGLAIYYFMRNKKRKGYFFTPKVVPPPHIIATEALDKLKARKLPQVGMSKEFYTELTDIIRNYIDGRFTINAPEMLTQDILDAVHLATDTKSSTESLRQILTLADLVKFAKFEPLQNENDLSLMNAYLFVNQTKKEEKLTDETNAIKKDEGMEETLKM